jgi:hypothetical protein
VRPLPRLLAAGCLVLLGAGALWVGSVGVTAGTSEDPLWLALAGLFWLAALGVVLDRTLGWLLAGFLGWAAIVVSAFVALIDLGHVAAGGDLATVLVPAAVTLMASVVVAFASRRPTGPTHRS